jgi:hypothetical protein
MVSTAVILHFFNLTRAALRAVGMRWREFAIVHVSPALMTICVCTPVMISRLLLNNAIPPLFSLALLASLSAVLFVGGAALFPDLLLGDHGKWLSQRLQENARGQFVSWGQKGR